MCMCNKNNECSVLDGTNRSLKHLGVTLGYINADLDSMKEKIGNLNSEEELRDFIARLHSNKVYIDNLIAKATELIESN